MYCRLCDIEYPKSLRFCKWCGGGLVTRESIVKQHCPSCGSKTEREWIFCNECGVDLATLGAQPKDVACPACSATVRKGWMFCRQCGEQIAIERAAHLCESCGAGTRASWAYCKQCGANLKKVDPLAVQDAEFRTVAGIPALPIEEVEPFSDLKSGELPPLENVIKHASQKAAARQPVAEVSAEVHQGTHPFTTSRNTGHLDTDSLVQELRNHTASVPASTAASFGRLEAAELIHEAPATSDNSDQVTAMPLTPPAGSPPIEPLPEVAAAAPPVEPAPSPIPPPPSPPPVAPLPPPPPRIQVDPMSSTQVMSSQSAPTGGMEHTQVMQAPIYPDMASAPLQPPPAQVGGMENTLVMQAPVYPEMAPVEPAPTPSYPPPTPAAIPAFPPVGQGGFQETGTLYPSQALPAPPQPHAMSAAFPPPAAPAPSASSSSGKYIVLGVVALGLIGILAVAAMWFWMRTHNLNDSPVASTPVSEPAKPETPGATQPAAPATPTGMVLVPGGSIDLGTSDAAADPYSRPAHEVSVGKYFMDATEVTNADYKKFVDESGHAGPAKGWTGGGPGPGTESMPVVYVTWADAKAYADWAGKRLPTEQEWEFAARGTDGRPYPWGTQWDLNKANIGKDANSGRIQSVGSYGSSESPFGVKDLIGNVWEWTSSSFSIYPGGDKSLASFTGTNVIRGGAFDATAINTAMYRGFQNPKESFPKVGFRCVKDAP